MTAVRHDEWKGQNSTSVTPLMRVPDMWGGGAIEIQDIAVRYSQAEG